MCVVMEITALFLNKLLNGSKKPAHVGKDHRTMYEGGFWSVYWISVAMWIVVLLLNSHLVFVTKPAPTRDSNHKDELNSVKKPEEGIDANSLARYTTVNAGSKYSADLR